jgi:hypothetical protein
VRRTHCDAPVQAPTQLLARPIPKSAQCESSWPFFLQRQIEADGFYLRLDKSMVALHHPESIVAINSSIQAH